MGCCSSIDPKIRQAVQDQDGEFLLTTLQSGNLSPLLITQTLYIALIERNNSFFAEIFSIEGYLDSIRNGFNSEEIPAKFIQNIGITPTQLFNSTGDEVVSFNIKTERLSPLMVAVYTSNIEAISFFIKNKLFLSEKSNSGYNFLHTACMLDSASALWIISLMSAGTIVESSLFGWDHGAETGGLTPLMMACVNFKTPSDVVYEVYLRTKACPSAAQTFNAKDHSGRGILHHACVAGRFALIAALLHEADLDHVNSCDQLGYTPIMLLARHDHWHPKVVSMFHNRGVDCNPHLVQTNLSACSTMEAHGGAFDGLSVRMDAISSLREIMGSLRDRVSFNCNHEFDEIDEDLYYGLQSSSWNRYKKRNKEEKIQMIVQRRKERAYSILSECKDACTEKKDFFWKDDSWEEQAVQKFSTLINLLHGEDAIDESTASFVTAEEVEVSLDELPTDSLFLRKLNSDGTVEWLQGSDLTNLAPNTSQLTLPLVHVSPKDISAIQLQGFNDKVDWFKTQMALLRINGTETLKVSRSDLVNTACSAFMSMEPKDFLKNFRFDFENEQGLDYGGLTQEFWTLIIEETFGMELGLFKYGATDNLTVQIDSEANGKHHNYRQLYRFAGRVLGKALIDQHPVNVHLSRPLFKHMLGLPVSFADLAFVNKELYDALCWMEDSQGVETLCYTFSVPVKRDGNTEEIELKPNGKDIEVNDTNKFEYVQLRFKYEMIENTSEQLFELLVGLYEIVPLALLTVFDFQELELLMCSIEYIDVDDWQHNTEYEGFTPSSDTVIWFWQIVRFFSEEQKARLLQYVTGTSRVPLGGFKELQGSDGEIKKFRLKYIEANTPNAHTCFNRLDLPEFSSFENLKFFLEGVIIIDVTGFNED